jgi:hypothetical protein
VVISHSHPSSIDYVSISVLFLNYLPRIMSPLFLYEFCLKLLMMEDDQKLFLFEASDDGDEVGLLLIIAPNF